MSLVLSLKNIPHISLIYRLAKKDNDLWLVGGFLRDIYLNQDKSCLDFDFVVAKNSCSFAREFARSIKAKCIVLDEPRKTFRVIFKKNNKVYTYDFSLIRGRSIKEDLSLRDFSINSLGLDLRNKKPEIIDYFGAKKDISKKLIRTLSPGAIGEDPLRILRGFVFSLKFGFRIEAATLKIMKKNRELISKVSAERINEELFKIFGQADSYSAIASMDKLRLIDVLVPYIKDMRGLPQGGYHHLGVWQHSLETLRQFEWLLKKRLSKDKAIMSYLNQEVASGHKFSQVIKLACLLHDIGKPQAKKKLKKRTIFHTHEKIGRDLAAKVCQDLRISLKETEMIKKLIFWHLRPGYLADQITPSARAVYRFFRDCNNQGAAVILLSLSDWRATRGPLTNSRKRARHEKIMIDLVDEYFAQTKKKPLGLLLNGHQVMEKFKIKPGVLVGEVLTKLKEEQALGKIKTKTQAYALAKKTIKGKS